MVKGMSSCLLHPSHKLNCTHLTLQLKTPKMFGLDFDHHQHYKSRSSWTSFSMTNNVVVTELACASTSSSVAEALHEEKFQVGLEPDFAGLSGLIDWQIFLGEISLGNWKIVSWGWKIVEVLMVCSSEGRLKKSRVKPFINPFSAITSIIQIENYFRVSLIWHEQNNASLQNWFE